MACFFNNSGVRCHTDFPNLCGDKKRCFSHADNCWDKACLHTNCLQISLSLPRDIQGNRELMSQEQKRKLLRVSVGNGFDQRQFKFLLKCPNPEERLTPCGQTSYGNICYYLSEWECEGRCIPKSQTCQGKCHWGMERCFDLGSNVCIDRYTPCGGR